YPDVAAAVAQGRLPDPLQHYLEYGCREGRFPSAVLEQKAAQSPSGRGGASGAQIDLGGFLVPLDWPVQGEIRKTFILRIFNGFFRKYLSGSVILDVGYRGGRQDAVPIFPHATGVDL